MAEQVAARLQDPVELGERRHGLRRVEVLDHVGELDPVEARVGPGQRRHVADADVGVGVLGERLPGDIDGGGGVVDAADLGAGAGAGERDLAAAAARVQDLHPGRRRQQPHLLRLVERDPAVLLELVPALADLREEVLAVVDVRRDRLGRRLRVHRRRG